MMHNGRIFKEGAPRRSRTTSEVQAIYLGSGPWLDPARAPAAPKAVLQVQDLQVYYGESHALQGVSLTLERGVLSVVGRNGMGKTTLCNTIIGLMRGALRRRSASTGRDILGKLSRMRSRAPASASCRRAGACGRA